MKRSRLFFVVLIVIGLLGLVYDRLLGMVAEPFLEKVMTRAFDMPVHVTGLRIYPWPARVEADKIVFLNPPGFRRRDQFTAKGITCTLDLSVLKNKFIRIRAAHFREVVFAIESYMTPQGSRNNVWHWYHHMGLDEDTPPIPSRPLPDPDNIGEHHWRVRIGRLDLDNGTIIFDDRRDPEEQRWIFEHLRGFWTGFDFLSDYVSPTFTETIQLEGTFGSNPPAHFKGGGPCQFADGDNFDVDAEVTGGSIAEYDFLMAGIPGEVTGGTFDLKSHFRVVESDLKSEHRLTLRAMKLVSPTTTQKLFKYPFGALQLLLEEQKAVELDLRVDGYIGDPKFRVFSAFTKALQKALLNKTKAGIKGTVKIATGTPKQVASGLTKIGSILTDPFVRKDKVDGNTAGEKPNV
jgi:hypothetical protein